LLNLVTLNKTQIQQQVRGVKYIRIAQSTVVPYLFWTTYC